MVKSIFLQDGEEIFVDDEDYERVCKLTWYSSYYGNSRRVLSTQEKILLNSYITPGSFQIKKNNYFTKDNLTTKGNKTRWSKPMIKGSSQYKGVHRNQNKFKRIWKSTIVVDGKQKFLGNFDTQEEAAQVYNDAVIKYWDGQGYLNEINKNNKLIIAKNKSQNFYDTRILSNSSFKGVYKDSKEYTFNVGKYFNGSYVHFGRDKSLNNAALIYNKCVFYLYGDNAILNDVPMKDELEEFISNWEIPERIKALKLNEEVVNNGD
ncbi:AP2 domain-containing protein [Staphylococcus agnetis]|uniref:AP2 domain-containing protein n=1 Tax=Staphylococcus agnetis TaxID=985762 RepID=UPI00208DE43B|nr:AP2 domain-containing protein [Staphylococcus agnetis]MCO4357286.1 AP2 domain-containing protein [Staphylococcus agnetis]